RFKIRRLLGQGTFGKVMECEDGTNGRLVAIKVIRAVPKYRDAAKVEIRVLQTLQRNDPSNLYQCMHVNETFDHRNHVCMLFDLLGPSVFDFLKENEFRPFSLHHVQLFAEQLLRSVAFLHSLNLVHTDLKPENILLESGEFDVVPFGNNLTAKTHMLKSTNIRLIDFGSATFNNEYHAQVVSTRHYRAPEIILNLGWSFPCDMWSIGCIILELLTGEALFQTHENNEHLAMMEVVVGKAPAHIVRSVPHDLRAKFFRSDMSARYPAPDQPRQSQKGLRAMRSLSQLVNPATNPMYANLHDLLFRLLQYDPRARITAKEACDHPFFRYRVGPDGRLVNRPMAPTHHGQQSAVAPATVIADIVQPMSASTQQHRPSFPTPAGVLPQQPPSVAVPPLSASFCYGTSTATTNSGTGGRALLHVSDYSIGSASGMPSSQHHGNHYQPAATKAAVMPSQLSVVQQQQQAYYYRDHQHPAPAAVAATAAMTTHSAYHSDYSNRPTPHYYHQQPQQQSQSRPHADAYPWQYTNGASISTITTPTVGHSSGATAHHVPPPITLTASSYNLPPQPQSASGAVSQPRCSSKRKGGAPIDSGYFPDLLSSASECFPSSNGHSSPIMGALMNNDQQQPQQPQPQLQPPRNFSTGSSFTGVHRSGPVASPGYSAGYGASKGCNLPSLSSHAFQPSASSALTMAPIMTPGASGVSLPQQQHAYHQQRHLLNMAASGANSNGSGSLARLPIDANATPRLTTATTATPTPGSSSAHLSSSHSLESNMPAAAMGNMGAPASGTHKLAGRSLPSLMIAHSNTIPHAGSISNSLARTSLADSSLQQHHHHSGHFQTRPQQLPHSARTSYYQHLPSAQTLMQSPTQAGSGPMDYTSVHHHHHQSYAQPSSANNPAGY
ncbi:serine threonine protein kinase CMGC group, partial [Kickxella alabastrina]